MIPFIPIDENKKKCRIGEGCLYAVVSSSGHLLKKTNLEDDYGTDFEILELEEFAGEIHDLNIFFGIQLKTSTNWQLQDNEIIYDLEAKAYNNMILHNIKGAHKKIIVIMCLNNETEQTSWCTINEAHIKFQNSLFWYYIESKEKTDNSGTKRIHIPVTNVFNADAIQQLINDFRLTIVEP